MQTSGPDNKKKILIAAAALLLIPTAFFAIRQAVQPGAESQKQETVSTAGTEGTSTESVSNTGAMTSQGSTTGKGVTSDSAKPTDASGTKGATSTAGVSKSGSAVIGGVTLGTTTSSGTTGTATSPAGAGKGADSKSAALESKPAEKKGLVSSILGAIFPGKAPAPSAPGGTAGLSGSSVGTATGAGAGAVGTGAVGGLVGGAKQAQVSDTPPPAPVATQGCYTVTFHHKKTSGHSNEEACMQHKNLIRIPHPSPASICVRMNKVPVTFELVKGKTNELVVGAIAGPKAEITARYCVGPSTCAEDCKIPKDDFMDAIGAGGELAAPAKVAQWDPADKADKDSDVNGHLDAEMKRELDKLDEAPAQAATEVFKDWVTASESPACGTKHAMN